MQEDMRAAMREMSFQTQNLISSTMAIAEDDACESPVVMEFINAVTGFADGVIGLLNVIQAEEAHRAIA